MDPLSIGVLAAGTASGLAQSFASYKANQLNVQSQEKLNARQWELQDYWRQQDRQWALQDWEKTQPLQVMQRLREAGLNPNLIYGNGAASTATMVRSSSGMSPAGSAPHRQAIPIPDIGQIMANAVEMGNQNKTAALMQENLKKDLELKDQKGQMNALDMLLKDLAGKRGRFEFNLRQKLEDSILQRAENENQALRAGTQKTISEVGVAAKNARLHEIEVDLKAARNQAEIKRTIADALVKEVILSGVMPEKVKQAKEFTKSMQFDNAIKQVEVQLAKQGVFKGGGLTGNAITALARLAHVLAEHITVSDKPSFIEPIK